MSPERSAAPLGDLLGGIFILLDTLSWILAAAALLVAVLAAARYGWIRHPWTDAAVALLSGIVHGAIDEYERRRAAEDDAAAPALDPETPSGTRGGEAPNRSGAER